MIEPVHFRKAKPVAEARYPGFNPSVTVLPQGTVVSEGTSHESRISTNERLLVENFGFDVSDSTELIEVSKPRRSLSRTVLARPG